uniref:AAA+ ATPase domain-containing protein n=1 Tax=Ananas comosus var. bracteatus TaxID=296719 RepID=A0A6V7QBU1_ANACO|nr:unnamed protein product [Ananas comosus var. bracteatus]
MVVLFDLYFVSICVASFLPSFPPGRHVIISTALPQKKRQKRQSHGDGAASEHGLLRRARLGGARATGGHSPSASAAADWILSRSESSSTPTTKRPPSSAAATNNSNHSSASHSQPTLARFFPNLSPNSSPSSSSSSKRPHLAPLSERMRPTSLDSIVGQPHLLGPLPPPRPRLLPLPLPSLILWGPPGSGKTSLARALSNSNSSSSDSCLFVPLSAVSASVRDLRDAAAAARRRSPHPHRPLRRRDPPLLPIQQDALLPALEDGSLALLGATTENPSFHLSTPLLSRCRVLALRPLSPAHVRSLLARAISDPDRGLPLTTRSPVSVDPDAVEFLSLNCDGDARVALNALELAASLAAAQHNSPSGDRDAEAVAAVSVARAKEAMQCKHLAYDRAGDEHYNLISALHKSMRGSDPDAAIYWLARMLEGGEQPLYIARRLVRFASEDVGLADPAALGHAVACYQACHFLGMPECDVCLAQCAAYLARAPKSVAVYRALSEARRVVQESVGGTRGCRCTSGMRPPG